MIGTGRYGIFPNARRDRPRAPTSNRPSQRERRRASLDTSKLSGRRKAKIAQPQINLDTGNTYTAAYTPIRTSIEYDVVIEFGTRYCKVGFAIDGSPRCMVDTCLYATYYNLFEKYDIYKYKKGERITPESVWLSQTPLSAKAWETILFQFMQEVLLNHLHVMASQKSQAQRAAPRALSNRKVILSIDPYLPSFIEHGLMQALYSLGANAICTVNSLTAGVFCTGGDTAYVVDLGFSGVKMQGLIGGHICMESMAHAPIGMWTIMKIFKDEMRVLTKDKLDFDKLKISPAEIEKVVCRTAFCAPRDWEKTNANVVGYEFQTSVGTACVNILGRVRWKCCEALWGRNDWEINIAHLFLDKLLQCPCDLRKRLANNILFCGGVCQIGGFEKRFLQEIEKAIKELEKYHKLQTLNFRLVEMKKYEPNCRLWVGSSVFAALKPDPVKRYGRYRVDKQKPDIFLNKDEYLEKWKKSRSKPKLQPLKDLRKLRELRRKPETSEANLQESSDSDEYLAPSPVGATEADAKLKPSSLLPPEELQTSAAARRESRSDNFLPQESDLYRIDSMEKQEQEMAAEIQKLHAEESVNSEVSQILNDTVSEESGGGELGAIRGGVSDILQTMNLDPDDLQKIGNKLSSQAGIDRLFSDGPEILSNIPEKQRNLFSGFLVDIIQQLQEEILEVEMLLTQVRKHNWSLSIDDFKEIYAFISSMEETEPSDNEFSSDPEEES